MLATVSPPPASPEARERPSARDVLSTVSGLRTRKWPFPLVSGLIKALACGTQRRYLDPLLVLPALRHDPPTQSPEPAPLRRRARRTPSTRTRRGGLARLESSWATENSGSEARLPKTINFVNERSSTSIAKSNLNSKKIHISLLNV